MRGQEVVIKEELKREPIDNDGDDDIEILSQQPAKKQRISSGGRPSGQVIELD